MDYAQEQLVLDHLQLVKMRMWQLGYERLSCADELGDEGRLALIKAALTFDPSRGVPFEKWAIIKIDGALRDFMRGQDTMTREERRLYRKTGIFLTRGITKPATNHCGYRLDLDALKRSMMMVK